MSVLHVLLRNIDLTMTFESLCKNKSNGDDEVLINNRHRTVHSRECSTAIIDSYFVISF